MCKIKNVVSNAKNMVRKIKVGVRTAINVVSKKKNVMSNAKV